MPRPPPSSEERSVAGAPPHRRIALMGCPLDVLSMEETLDRVEAVVRSGRPHQHMAINAAKFAAMEKNAELRAAVRRSDVITADGASIVTAARFLGSPLPERVAGIDLFQAIVARAAQRSWRLYFLGAKPEIVRKTVEVLSARHPGLIVAGYRDGYFSKDEEEAVATSVRDARADALFVAISPPKKEIFLARWMETMQVPWCMGVGGSFDVIAGKSRRAPEILQRAGLEWFFRFVQEPRRLGRRMWLENGRFVLRVAQARFGGYRLPE
jgi:N-acetylglucosaminyldiphosphoundecaprenol N-acetyl-beta-D-mannosaminyltransferase